MMTTQYTCYTCYICDFVSDEIHRFDRIPKNDGSGDALVCPGCQTLFGPILSEPITAEKVAAIMREMDAIREGGEE